MYSNLEVFLINLVSSLLLYHVNLDLIFLFNELPIYHSPLKKSWEWSKLASRSCGLWRQLIVMLLVVIGLTPVGENWGAKRRFGFEFNSSCWVGFARAQSVMDD
jgi:hypothetical protein